MANKIFLILIIFIISLGLSCSSNDIGFKVKYITRSSLKQPGKVFLYDTSKDKKFIIKEDYWDKVGYLWCGELKTKPVDRKQHWPDDYMFSAENMSVDLSSNTIIDKYNVNSLEVEKLYGTCNQDAGITSFKTTVYQSIKNSKYPRWTGFLYFYTLYNVNTDSLYFVDSLFRNEHYYFQNGFIDSSGNNFYYNKREFALKYNIANGTIDTLYQGEIPVIPVNSSDVLVYSKQDHKLRLLNDTYTVEKEIRCDEIIPITVYKVDEFKYLIGKRHHPTFTLHVNKMKVLLYDFSNQTETELFVDDLGEIIGVID